MIPTIVTLAKYEDWALVSDAGTPLISDPGYKVVRQCLLEGIKVESLPGPSAVITALTLSGLPPDKFLFLGYLPEKPSHSLKLLEKIKLMNEKDLKATYIIFVAPHKLIKTLHNVEEVFGDIEVVLAKELTKIHQSVQKKIISQWLEDLKNPKGEYSLLFSLNS